MTPVIDQQTPHGLRAERESVRPSLPLVAAFVLPAHPRFVYERGRLQRVIASLASQIATRDAAQLAVDDGKEFAGMSRGLALGRHQSVVSRGARIPDARP